MNKNGAMEQRLSEELQTWDTDLLVAIFHGTEDVKYLIAKELQNRDLDSHGRWVGPSNIKEAWSEFVVTVVDGKKYLIRK